MRAPHPARVVDMREGSLQQLAPPPRPRDRRVVRRRFLQPDPQKPPPPATPSLAPSPTPRSIPSAAAESTSPAPGSDAPSSAPKTSGTAPPQSRRTRPPPAVHSIVPRTDAPPTAADRPWPPRILPAVPVVCGFPGPCRLSQPALSSAPADSFQFIPPAHFHHGLLAELSIWCISVYW